MGNLVFALENVWINMSQTFWVLAENKIVWGFTLGFFVSTVVHLLIVSESPSRIPHILMKSPMASYKRLNPQEPHADHKSFELFSKEHRRVRLAVGLSLCAMLVFIVTTIAQVFFK